MISLEIRFKFQFKLRMEKLFLIYLTKISSIQPFSLFNLSRILIVMYLFRVHRDFLTNFTLIGIT